MAKNDDLEINRELLAILDKLLEEGKWDSSLFLQASSKKIKDLRNNIFEFIERAEAAPEAAPSFPGFGKGGREWSFGSERPSVPVEPMDVYVGLYQADGMNLNKWAQSLSGLLSRSSTPPIY